MNFPICKFKFRAESPGQCDTDCKKLILNRSEIRYIFKNQEASNYKSFDLNVTYLRILIYNLIQSNYYIFVTISVLFYY